MQNKEYGEDSELRHDTVLDASIKVPVGVEHQAAGRKWVKAVRPSPQGASILQGRRDDTRDDATLQNQARCVEVVS